MEEDECPCEAVEAKPEPKPSNVIVGSFGGDGEAVYSRTLDFTELESLYDDIYACIAIREGRLPIVAVLGIFELIKNQLIDS